MSLLTIFANFFIDTNERFLRVQDSFHSFCNVDADRWVINVRGRYKEETIIFLKNNLGERLISYTKQSDEGWFYDSQTMLDDIVSPIVLFWLEDHVNIAPIELLNSIVYDMHKHDIDYLLYTFWQNGHLRNRFNGIPLKNLEHFDYFTHTIENNAVIQHNIGGSYIITAAAILKTSFFKRIISTDDPIPRRWPKETPFDFEKAPTDVHWLPIVVGVPKQELFASIDDDHGIPKTSLQSRGLYPIREKRKSYTQSGIKKFLYMIKKIFVRYLHRKK